MSANSTIVNGKKDGTKQPDRGTYGRYVETPVDRMSPEMLDAFEFTKTLRGEVPGPHKIWCSNPELSKTIVPTGAYFQTQALV
jgi:4-carboxymuconolactone decarboxylase